MLDFYQGVLLGCSHRLKHGRWSDLVAEVSGRREKATGDLTHGGLEAVLDQLQGFPEESAKQLRALKKFRNDFAHNVDYAPRRVIKRYLDDAERLRGELESAADETAMLLDELKEFPREVLALVIELDNLSQMYAEDYEEDEITKLQEAGHSVAASVRDAPIVEDIKTYGRLTAWVAILAERQALADEARAIDAAADEYAAMMED